MADETNLPDLNAVLTEQQETIKTLTDQLKTTATGDSQPIYNTTPTEPSKPKNYVVYILIGAVVFLIFFRGGKK